MANSFFTRPDLDNRAFRQETGSTLTLSGTTNFEGILQSKGIEIDGGFTGTTSSVSGHVLTFLDGKIQLAPSTSTDIAFDGERTVTRSGIPNVNVSATTVTEFLENYFFPAVDPDANISISPSSDASRYFGNDDNVTLAWQVDVNTFALNTIKIFNEGTEIASPTPTEPAGGTESGNVIASVNISNYNPSTGTTQRSQSFSIDVEDSQGNSDSDSTTVTWRHKRYWFKTSNNYTQSDETTIEDILNGSGPVSLIGSEFTTSENKNFGNINFSNERFYFAWQKALGVPTFVVNGLVNNGWGNSGTGTLFEIIFTNPEGYDETFYVAKSDNSISGTFSITTT